MNMKKLLQIPLLLVVLFLSSIPISAHDFEVDGIYYKIIDKWGRTVKVTYQGNSFTEYSNEYTGSVTLPSIVTYNDVTYSVTSIGDYAFRSCTGLTSVTIPNSVTEIGYYAFGSCTGLTSITIGNSVNSIGEYAFNCCSSLLSIIIPNSVTSIGDGAFCGCTGLTSVTIPNSVTEIGYYAFGSCTGLTSITIGNSVNSIGEYAFNGCSNLSEVNILDLSAWCKIDFFIGNAENTVYYNTSSNPLSLAHKFKLRGEDITNLVIPNDITEIKQATFVGCTNLASIIIPNSVTSIGRYAFYGCSNVELFEVPNSLAQIGAGAIPSSAWCNKLPEGVIYLGKVLYKYNGEMPNDTSIEVVDGTTSIYPSAFYNCKGLISISIPYTVNDIGDNAFYNCVNLKSISIPHSVTTIGNYAFRNCDGLTSGTIPSSVTSIGYNIFRNCSNLKEISIGCNTADNVIYECYKLNRINILSSVKSINMGELLVDNEYNDFDIYIEHSSEPLEIVGDKIISDYYYRAIKCKKIYLNRDLKMIAGNYKFESFNEIIELTIGRQVTNIPYYMFEKCENLKKINIEDATTKLSLEPIVNCYLDSIYIGRNISNMNFIAGIKTLKLISVGKNVDLASGMFANCDSLKSLTLPFAGAGTALSPSNFGELFGTAKNDNMRAVTQFFEDGTNKTYYLPTGLEELTLTEGCEIIPYGGLYNCNMLKTLTLPTSLYMVGEKALYGCAKITDIYCKGADPAVAYDNSFDGMRLTSCKLHVPHNSSERYKISDGWKRFYYIEEEAQLMISIAKSIENAGVVYGINEYQPGQVAEIEAVAHSGYTFVGWYENGNLLTTDSKYTLMVTESHSLVAMFTPVLDENDIEVKPSDESVTLSWHHETGATYYSLNIYSDASMTIEVGNVVVDNNGQPVSRSASSSIATTIDGLSEMQNYYYSITAFGENDAILSKYIRATASNFIKR